MLRESGMPAAIAGARLAEALLHARTTRAAFSEREQLAHSEQRQDVRQQLAAAFWAHAIPLRTTAGCILPASVSKASISCSIRLNAALI